MMHTALPITMLLADADTGMASTTTTPTGHGHGPEHRDQGRNQIQDCHQHEKTVVIVFGHGQGQEGIVPVVADVMGRPWTVVTSLSSLSSPSSPPDMVFGILDEDFMATNINVNTNIGTNRVDNTSSLVLIHTHCVDDDDDDESATLSETLTQNCHYEFLYSRSSCSSPFLRRDLTRFLSLILGQLRPHEALRMKSRTNFISTTFPDVRAALPNLDILSVGSDAVEIRVDLLVEPGSSRSDSTATTTTGLTVPSLKYVGQQLMLLRQRTELPIIFTARCTRENGKFPMDDPGLFYRYLRRAIQWGVEYIDVELWLPEEIRRRLAQEKGNSIIMSAFHDFSGTWKWMSPEAQRIFVESAKYADIVKMIAMVHTIEANYELEYFRSTVKEKYMYSSDPEDTPTPLFSAVNMGPMGQLSRVFNTVFSPITHPLLPKIAAPGQLTAAEINEALHIMGQLPKRNVYAIGSFRSTPQSMFMEKCFNELSLPHGFRSIDLYGTRRCIETVVTQPNFGGAYVNPPIAVSEVSSSATAETTTTTTISDAARAIGFVDTITVPGFGICQNGQRQQQQQRTSSKFIGENATWKGIRATLTRDYIPSAYKNRTAIILSNTESDVSAAIFALRSLDIGNIYTIGFKARGPLSSGLKPFSTSIPAASSSAPSASTVNNKFAGFEKPFVIVSALAPEKSLLVQPLLKHYGRFEGGSDGKMVYLDLTGGERESNKHSRNGNGYEYGKGDSLGVARSSGWSGYGIEDVNAWTVVEMLKLLVGQNVPFDFVRMVAGYCDV